jgi:dTDP-4-dehydrorhamnose 3,5-epimerase
VASVAGEIAGLEVAHRDSASVRADGERLRDPIDGVSVRRAVTHADERGSLTEILDDRWSFTDDPIVYVYHVTIRPGQLRGWVVHRVQNDRLFAYAGVLKIVLYDGRVDSSTYGRINILHVGLHDPSLISIPAGVYHAVQNVGADEAAFVNLPSEPYRHDDPDKYRLPRENDVIPYRL